LYTLFAARRVGDTGAVWGFEPSEREFDRLLENLRLNDIGNVHAFRIALADIDGQGELAVADAEHSGQNTLGAFGYDVARELRKEPVTLRRVDHVVNEHNITRLDVLKIDVEGAELRLIEGAHETLSRFRPVILFEVLDAALRHQGGGSEALCGALSALHYRLYVFNDDTGLPTPAAPGQFGDNMIGVPAEQSLPEAVFELAPRESTDYR
jgi:FkbM family methyltransferase